MNSSNDSLLFRAIVSHCRSFLLRSEIQVNSTDQVVRSLLEFWSDEEVWKNLSVEDRLGVGTEDIYVYLTIKSDLLLNIIYAIIGDDYVVDSEFKDDDNEIILQRKSTGNVYKVNFQDMYEQNISLSGDWFFIYQCWLPFGQNIKSPEAILFIPIANIPFNILRFTTLKINKNYDRISLCNLIHAIANKLNVGSIYSSKDYQYLFEAISHDDSPNREHNLLKYFVEVWLDKFIKLAIDRGFQDRKVNLGDLYDWATLYIQVYLYFPHRHYTIKQVDANLIGTVNFLCDLQVQGKLPSDKAGAMVSRLTDYWSHLHLYSTFINPPVVEYEYDSLFHDLVGKSLGII